jgi:SagB-type dehydrogenase family enzyme
MEGAPIARSRYYPGFPEFQLQRPGRRRWRNIFTALAGRMSQRNLSSEPLDSRELSELLYWSHGTMRAGAAGPVPSSGGLQSLELYLVNLVPGWLATGVYHFCRDRHSLAQLSLGCSRERWRSLIPSMDHVSGGSLLWIVVGSGELIAEKYGERSQKLLCLEAGHLMQNICLVATTLNACTVPFGGFLERQIARELQLCRTDQVLYAGILGKLP